MRLPIAVALLLLTSPTVADELYVPMAAQTEVEIVNTSPRRASVDVQVLGDAATRIELAAGEAFRWTGSQHDLGVLRVAANASLRVTAVSRFANATVSLPVLTPRDMVREAAIEPRGGAAWRGGIIVVNPSDASIVAFVDDVPRALGPLGVLRGSRVHADTPLLVFAYDANDRTGARVFTRVAPLATTRKRRSVRSGPPATPQTQTVVLFPWKDNSLFETTDGGSSNGAGPHLFTGATAARSRRRALLAFNVAAQLPPGTQIVKATLAMRVSQTISGAEAASLHRVARDWGEGSSNAGNSGDGRGAPAANGDATWLHTFFPATRWSAPGGDFDTAADATAPVATTTGTWQSAAMTARVQQWLDQPATNFGWIAIGNENRTGSAKRLDSREVQPPASRPSLTIEFRP